MWPPSTASTTVAFPVPSIPNATNNLFNLFHGELVLPAAPSALKPCSAPRGGAYLWIGLGHAAGEARLDAQRLDRGRNENGVTWRARGDQPGSSAATISRPAGYPLAGGSPDRRARRRTKNRARERSGCRPASVQ